MVSKPAAPATREIRDMACVQSVQKLTRKSCFSHLAGINHLLHASSSCSVGESRVEREPGSPPGQAATEEESSPRTPRGERASHIFDEKRLENRGGERRTPRISPATDVHSDRPGAVSPSVEAVLPVPTSGGSESLCCRRVKGEWKERDNLQSVPLHTTRGGAPCATSSQYNTNATGHSVTHPSEPRSSHFDIIGRNKRIK